MCLKYMYTYYTYIYIIELLLLIFRFLLKWREGERDGKQIRLDGFEES